MSKSNLEEMSLRDHITELRKRLLWSFLYIILIFIICFYFADELFGFLAYPLVKLMDTENGQGFIYTALQEAFFTELKIAFFQYSDSNGIFSDKKKRTLAHGKSSHGLNICPLGFKI